jgi:hypothetical protein
MYQQENVLEHLTDNGIFNITFTNIIETIPKMKLEAQYNYSPLPPHTHTLVE